MFVQRMFCYFSKSSSLAAQVSEDLSIGSSSSGAAEVPEDLSSSGGAEIPEDLLIEILLRVPIEFVAKFRNLSKFHRDLIDSPDFERKHSLLSLKKPTCSHMIRWYNDDKVFQVIKLDSTNSGIKVQRMINSVFKDKGYTYMFVGCCVGILCFRYHPKNGEEPHIILWNPFTGSYSRRIKYHMNPPRESSTWFFGHDAATDDLKVLKVRHGNYDDPSDIYNYDCEIYSFKMDCWRKIISEKLYALKIDSSSRGVFVEGTNSIHFINVNDRHAITAFNFSSEKFHRIPLPTEWYRLLRSGLSCLDGRLCICLRNCRRWSVWTMKEYGVKESWTWLCCLDDYVDNAVMVPLGFVNDGRILLLLMTDYEDPGKYHVIQYDIEEKKQIKNETIYLIELEYRSPPPPTHFLYTPSFRRV